MLKYKFPLQLNERFDPDTVDAAKGLLILLVIWGHASNFWDPEPFISFSVKFFHVACFLLFPFIYDIRPMSKQTFKNIVAKYYAPFLFFVLGYAALYFIYAAPNVEQWGKAIGQALIFGNKPMLDSATGLSALWFMPVLISIVLLNGLLIGRLRLSLWILLPFALALHLYVGGLDQSVKYNLPMGLANAFYLLFIGYLIRLLCLNKTKEYLSKNSHVFLLILFMGIFFSSYYDTLIKFPLILLPDYTNIKTMIIHDGIIIAAFMFLITTPYLKKINFLKYCGQHSLTLYLTHLVFLAFSMEFAKHHFVETGFNVISLLIVIGIFLFSLSGGFLCHVLLTKLPLLKNTIMPTSWENWAITPNKQKDK